MISIFLANTLFFVTFLINKKYQDVCGVWRNTDDVSIFYIEQYNLYEKSTFKIRKNYILNLVNKF